MYFIQKYIEKQIFENALGKSIDRLSFVYYLTIGT